MPSKQLFRRLGILISTAKAEQFSFSARPIDSLHAPADPLCAPAEISS